MPAAKKVNPVGGASGAGAADAAIMRGVSRRNGTWVKVRYLREGMMIAVASSDGGTALWDRIEKIEHLPAEQVYDIEVEGTHNFVAGHYVDRRTGRALSEEQEEVVALRRSLERGAWDREDHARLLELARKTENPALLRDFEDSALQGDSLLVTGEAIIADGRMMCNQKTAETAVFGGSPEQGISCFANGAAILANRENSSSVPVENHKTLDLGGIAPPEPRWQNRVSLLSRPRAIPFYQKAHQLLQALSSKLQVPGLDHIEFGGIVAHNTYIHGTTTIQGGLLTPSISATSSLGIYTAGAAAPRMVVDASGNVGIGTAGPLALLSVGASSQFQVNSSGNITTSGNSLDFTTAATTNYIQASGASSGLRFRTGGATDKVAIGAVGGVSVGNAYVGTDPGAGSMIISGNVGIGTTTPGSLLSVHNGNADIGGVLTVENNLKTGYLTATSSTASSFAGALGVGTTSPGSLFSVAGQCVTGDTRLRRRRRRKGGKARSAKREASSDGRLALDDVQDEYTYDEVRIDRVRPGDEIASLDEKTGRIVWSRVRALMDMGVKITYRLRTEDGREIRTTANHPYLTKYGWTKVALMREGTEIAVPDLSVFAALGDDRRERHQDDGQADNRQDEVKNHHTSSIYSLDLSSHKLNDQNKNVKMVPSNAWREFSRSRIAGSATEARETSAISEAMFESLFSWVSLMRGSIRSYLTSEYGDVKWVRIASIERVGEEQVYDIEVEGTHNFVAGHYLNRETGQALAPEQEEVVALRRSLERGTWNREDHARLLDLARKTENPALLRGLEDSTLQGISRFATDADSIASKQNVSSAGVDNSETLDLGGVAPPGPWWQTWMPLLSRPRAHSSYQNLDAFSTDDIRAFLRILKTKLRVPELDSIEFGGIVAHNTYIHGTTTIQGGLLTPSISATSSLGIYTAGAAAPRMVIDASGNVGIGTAGPTATLQIGSSPTVSAANTYISADTVGQGATFRVGWQNTPSRTEIRSTNNDETAFTALAVEGSTLLLNVRSTGNVGIGTTSPGSLLSVHNGNADIGGALTVENNLKTGYLTATSSIASFLNYASSTSLSLSNLLNVSGAGTSTFSGAMDVAANQRIQGNLEVLGATKFTNAPNFTGTGTTTFAGGIQATGLDSSRGLRVSAGDSIFAGGLQVAGTINVQNASGVNTFPIASTTSFSVADRLTVSGAGTSTFAGGLTLATSGGNVGIGTSSPGATFAVSGHGYFTGGLGVGILNNAASTLRVGQCVTGDTRLRRRRRRGKGNRKQGTGNKDEEYEYDEVQIKDVQVGDEILSLNESASRLEWQPILALYDMGEQPVYRIRTASGKTIRTTSNHPYLTQYGWVPVGDLRAGDEIAIPGNEALVDAVSSPDAFHQYRVSLDRELRPPIFSDAIAVRRFGVIGQVLGKLKGIGSRSVKAHLLQNALANVSGAFFEKILGLERVNDLHGNHLTPYRLSNSSWVTNFPALISAEARLSDARKGGLNVSMSSTVASSSSRSAFDSFQSTVSARDSSDSNFFRSQAGSSGLLSPPRNAFGLHGIFAVFSRRTRSAIRRLSKSSRGRRARMTSGNESAGCGSVWLFIRGYCKSISRRLSNDDSARRWDRILSIEYAGIERVWDISVKNTHNFVANGIIAHNTAFIVDSSGNVGIGTTTPGSLFSVHNGNADIGGVLTVENNLKTGYITATSSIASFLNFASSTSLSLSNLLNVNGAGTSTFAGALTVGTNGGLAVTSGAPANTLYVSSGGNVGIGTAGPGEVLTIQKTNVANAYVSYIKMQHDGNGTADYFIRRHGTTGQLDFYGTRASDSLFSFSNADTGQMVTITNSGNVGIGTTTPGALLEVGGAVGTGATRISQSAITHIYNSEANPRWTIDRDVLGSGLAAMTFGPGGATTIAAGGSAIGYPASRNLALYTSNGSALTERVRVDSTGNVGIGTTSPGVLLSVHNGNADIGGALTVENNLKTGYLTATSSIASFLNFASSTSLSLSNLLNVNGAGTSTFSGNFDIAANQRIQGNLEVLGATKFTSAPNFTGTGTTTFAGGIQATGLDSSRGLRVSAGDSIFAGGLQVAGTINVQNASGINIFPVASTTSFSVADRLTVSGAGTSTLAGPLSAGLLATASGLAITGGSFHSAVALNVTSAGTSTFAGGLAAAGLQSTANGLRVSGDTVLSGGLQSSGVFNFTGSGTSTLSGPLAHASGDLIVARGGTGNLLLNPYGGSAGFGTSTPWGAVAVEHLSLSSASQDLPAFVVSDLGTSTPSLVVLNRNGFVGIATRTPSSAFSVANTILFGSANATSTNVGNQQIDQNLSVKGASEFLGGIHTPELAITGSGTTTFAGGIQATGIDSSRGLRISAGDSIFAGGLNLAGQFNNSSSATSSFTGGLTVAGLDSSRGLRVSAGDTILAGGLQVAGTINVQNASGVNTFPIASTTSFSVADRLTVAGAGTSTFSGALTVGANGGLAVTSGAPANTLYVSSGGNVGIGTAGPGAALDVRSVVSIGANAASAGTIRLPNETYIYQRNAANNADVIAIGVNSSNQVNLGNGATVLMPGFLNQTGVGNNYFTGNVGIGTTSPGALFSVHNGSADIGGVLTVENNLKTGYILATSTTASSFGGNLGSVSSVIVDSDASGDGKLQLINTDTAIYRTSSILQFDNSLAGGIFAFMGNSNFGVATITPGATLSVRGGSLIEGLETASFFRATSTSVANLFPIASTTSFSVADRITVAGVGTSTFSGALDVAGNQRIQGNLEVLGATKFTSAPNFTGTGTTTFAGGVSSAGLASSNGLRVSAGDSIFAGGLQVAGTINVQNATGINTLPVASTTSFSVADRLTVSGAGTSTINGGFTAATGGGSFGVGTSTPAAFFAVAGNGPSYFAGNVGIGTAGPSGKLDVSAGNIVISGTNSAANAQSLLVNQTLSNGSGTLAGLQVQPIISGGSANVYGVYSQPSTAATAITVTNLSNFYAALPTIGAGSAVTNLYGLFIDNLSGATNNYSIYTGSAKSYFGGNVGIGSTTPGTLLSLHNGSSDIGGALTVENNLKTGYLQATSSTASFLNYASSTSLSLANLLNVNGVGTSTFSGALTVGSSFAAATATPTSAPYAASIGGNLLFGSNTTSGNATSTNVGNEVITGALSVKGPLELLAGCKGCGGGASTNAGIANRLAYYSSATGIDSANFLAVDTTNSFLGVGTGTPGVALGVTGTGLFSQNVIARNFTATSTSDISTFPVASTTSFSVADRLTVSGAGTSTFAGGLTVGANGGLAITSAAPANTLYVSSGGNVGIGTAAPTVNTSPGLDVVGDIKSRSGEYITGRASTISRWVTSAGAAASMEVNSLKVSGAAYEDVAPSAGNLIVEGNVGIGTTSPGVLLSVHNGNADIGGVLTVENNLKTGYLTATSSIASFFNFASSTSLSLSNLINVNGVGTSTFSGALTVGPGFFVASATPSALFPAGIGGPLLYGTNSASGANATSTNVGNELIAGNIQIKGLSGSTVRCLHVQADGSIAGAGADCGTGGGSSSGIAGTVQFSDGASGFSGDANTFFWDNTNKRLGIGTTTPGVSLAVHNGNADIGGALTVENNLKTGYLTATSSIASFFNYASSTSLSLSNLLNVNGAGTSTFAGGLDITGHLRAGSMESVGDFKAVAGNFSGRITALNASTTGSASVANLININGAGTSTFTGALNISPNGSGWLGIGTATPQAPLNIQAFQSQPNDNTRRASLRLDVTGTSSPGFLSVDSDGSLTLASNAEAQNQIINPNAPQWTLKFSQLSDSFQIQRSPQGPNYSATTHLNINRAGNVSIPIASSTSFSIADLLGVNGLGTSTFSGGLTLATSGGNVGIGTATPNSFALGVAGPIIYGNSGTSTNIGNQLINGGIQVKGLGGTGSRCLRVQPDGSIAPAGADCGTGGGSSSGIAGTVQFSDGASGFSGDANTFFWDNTNKRLGIGTSTPGVSLAVHNGALNVGGVATIENNVKTGYLTATSSTASFFNYASSTSFSLANLLNANGLGTSTFSGGLALATSAGTLGVGTSSPASFAAAIAGPLLYGNSGTSTNIGNELVNGNLSIKGNLELLGACKGCPAGGGGGLSSGIAGTVQFSDGASGFSGDANTFFWDNTNKRLGIGTSTPGATLSIHGPALIMGTTTSMGGLLVPSISATSTLGFYAAGGIAPSIVLDGSGLIRAGADGTTAIRLASRDGGTVELTIDTTNNRVQIGTGAGSGSPGLFVLDAKNTAGDPTGVNGAMYYNSNANKFRCYENSAWQDCSLTYNQRNAGIGTTTPGAPLSVGGLILANNIIATSTTGLNGIGTTSPQAFFAVGGTALWGSVGATSTNVGHQLVKGSLEVQGDCNGCSSFRAYTTNGTYTWNKPAAAKTIKVILCGSGGGGAGGEGAAAAVARGGGGGGGGGSCAERTFLASDLTATVTVTLGAGGTGGAGGSSAAGTDGGAGNTSTFGSYMTAYGGGGGGNDATSGGGGGGASQTTVGPDATTATGASGAACNGVAGPGAGIDSATCTGAGGAASTVDGGNGYDGGGGGGGGSTGSAAGTSGGSSHFSGAAGGGGGGVSAATPGTEVGGGDGGSAGVGVSGSGGGGAGGAAGGGAGQAGATGTQGPGGQGGGGGGGTNGTTGANGGTGGAGGGGGGGGGGGTSVGGAGGNGGSGAARVFSW